MNVPLFFVMEYVPGPTLALHVSQSKGLSLKEATSLVFKLCDTIGIAQKETILHRDLKPENIVLHSLAGDGPGVQEYDVVIVDYGLSFNRKDDEQLTK
jgi:serine/threonine protein kinase